MLGAGGFPGGGFEKGGGGFPGGGRVGGGNEVGGGGSVLGCCTVGGGPGGGAGLEDEGRAIPGIGNLPMGGGCTIGGGLTIGGGPKFGGGGRGSSEFLQDGGGPKSGGGGKGSSEFREYIEGGGPKSIGGGGRGSSLSLSEKVGGGGGRSSQMSRSRRAIMQRFPCSFLLSQFLCESNLHRWVLNASSLFFPGNCRSQNFLLLSSSLLNSKLVTPINNLKKRSEERKRLRRNLWYWVRKKDSGNAFSFFVRDAFAPLPRFNTAMDGAWWSRRSPVLSTRGVVSCSQPLAAQS